MHNKSRFLFFLLIVLGIAFIWSAYAPHDRHTWWLEIFPIIIALPILFRTYHKFEFTHLAYFLMLVHAIILLIGGHYTYAEVPFFSWLRDTYELSRNYYDRVGHFAQGFVPAIIVREILIRNSPLSSGRWLFFITCCICLSISVIYEFIEWWTAVYEGGAADAFLGTQGDVWDTQWDMFCALIGSVFAQISLSKLHDRLMKVTTLTV
jgi:putative membrane protein